MTNAKPKTKQPARKGRTAVKVHRPAAQRRPAFRQDETAEKAMFLDLLPVPVVTMDRDHTILYINQAGADAAGKPLENCIGVKFWDLFDSPGCRAGTCAASQAIRTGKVCAGEAKAIVQGREIAVKVVSAPRFDKNRQVVGCFEVVLNVSDELQLANELMRLSKSVSAGVLGDRANAEKLTGRHRELALSINSLLDSIIGPLKVAADYVNKLADGIASPQITEEYRGEFTALKNSLNAVTDMVHMRNADVELLTKAALEGRLEVRPSSTARRRRYACAPCP